MYAILNTKWFSENIEPNNVVSMEINSVCIKY